MHGMDGGVRKSLCSDDTEIDLNDEEAIIDSVGRTWFIVKAP